MKRKVPYSHILALDDCHFPKHHRGRVKIVGVFFSHDKISGILSSFVQKDGQNSSGKIIKMVKGSRFGGHIQLIMMKGIAFAGFNVVDIEKIYQSLSIPVLIISRKQPNYRSIHEALKNSVPGGDRKWDIIEKTGKMEKINGVFTQRAGLTFKEIEKILIRTTIDGAIPEPLRIAHMIAQGISLGESKGRA